MKRSEEGNIEEDSTVDEICTSNQVSPIEINVETDVDVESQNVDQHHQVQVEEPVKGVESLESVTEVSIQIEEKSAPPRLFSVHQSNVLYFLFFIGAALCLAGDMLMQYQR